MTNSTIMTCPHCSGTGQTLQDNGDPGLCNFCIGDTVIDVSYFNTAVKELEAVANSYGYTLQKDVK